MLNSISARPKKSHLDNLTGYFVVYVFIFLIVMCLFCGLWYSIWEFNTRELTSKYISGSDDSFFYCFITRFGNWLLIFGNFVPISMLLTLETAKFCQGYIMAIDKSMISSTNFPCEVHSSNLNEELGQIDYVLSDKTGTLTCNEMRFKYLIVGKTAYGLGTGYRGSVPKVKNVDFADPLAWQHLSNKNSNEGRKLAKAAELLGLCHTIVLEKSGEYNAASPDELAFVYFAKLVGCEFKGMDDDNFLNLDYFGQNRKFSVTDVIEFTSTRKRMTLVVRDERGVYTMYCKGADSIMIPRFDERSKEGFVEMMEHVDKFADEGLRTLLLGYKEMSESEYRRFKAEYDLAKNNLDNREKEMANVEDRWESGFTVVGATAIEDRLQDKVCRLDSPSRDDRVHQGSRHQALGAHGRQSRHREKHRLLLQTAGQGRHGLARVPEELRRPLPGDRRLEAAAAELEEQRTQDCLLDRRQGSGDDHGETEPSALRPGTLR